MNRYSIREFNSNFSKILKESAESGVVITNRGTDWLEIKCCNIDCVHNENVVTSKLDIAREVLRVAEDKAKKLAVVESSEPDFNEVRYLWEDGACRPVTRGQWVQKRGVKAIKGFDRLSRTNEE